VKTFPYWRAVGAAMRWARQQPHIQADSSTIADLAMVTDNRWRSVPNGTRVVARHAPGYDRTDVEVGRKDLDLTFFGVADAAELLRVLAALGLIPAHLAAGSDERYGRCETCGRLARWWDDPLVARWVHVQPGAVTGPAAHRAVVAESNTELNGATA
jgi:hypothetical protein